MAIFEIFAVNDHKGEELVWENSEKFQPNETRIYFHSGSLLERNDEICVCASLN